MSDTKIRGFEIVTAYKNNGIDIPKRATAGSAGYDIASAEDFIVTARKIGMVPTGLKVFMLPSEVFMIYLRSSIAIKDSVMIAQNVAVIDAGHERQWRQEGPGLSEITTGSTERRTDAGAATAKSASAG